MQTPTMSLTVPQGALEEETTITYQPIEMPEGDGSIAPLQAGYKFGPAGLQFNKPAVLKICYDAKDVIARGLQEKTMQIQYHDPDTGEFVSMGGDVDLVNHCVTSPIYHFSTYVLTAQILAVTNNAPTIGGASFFPGRLIEGLPATVRSSIRDWDPGSAIATARFYYRTAGSGAAFQNIAMLPEANDGAGQFFTAKIPGVDITAAGLEYYIEAFDTLNASRTRPAAAPTTFSTVAGQLPHPTTPIRFQTTVTQMTAGFSRDLTVQVRGNVSGTNYPVPADTLSFAGGKGTTARPNWLSTRYTAEIMGSSALDATYGSLNLSQPVTVYPGLLTRIEVLYNGAVLPDPLNVDAGSVTQLDAVGYDAYDNFTFVLPNFTTAGGIGSFGGPANYAQLFAANLAVDTSGTITATVGGLSATYNIFLNGSGAACQFDVGLFDSSCLYN
ncbi:MAG: hypothetical protein NXI24_22995 [bacterium]|nr:hypothetical protein [bacterium]